MLRLLTQLQQKLQVGYKTNITQIHQKIELYGSPTTKDLKKPHSSRRVGEAEMWKDRERWRGLGRHEDLEWWWN